MNSILVLNYILRIIFQEKNTSNIEKSIKDLSKIGNTREVIVRNSRYIEKVL
jgi:hypothetical protein